MATNKVRSFSALNPYSSRGFSSASMLIVAGKLGEEVFTTVLDASDVCSSVNGKLVANKITRKHFEEFPFLFAGITDGEKKSMLVVGCQVGQCMILFQSAIEHDVIINKWETIVHEVNPLLSQFPVSNVVLNSLDETCDVLLSIRSTEESLIKLRAKK